MDAVGSGLSRRGGYNSCSISVLDVYKMFLNCLREQGGAENSLSFWLRRFMRAPPRSRRASEDVDSVQAEKFDKPFEDYLIEQGMGEDEGEGSSEETVCDEEAEKEVKYRAPVPIPPTLKQLVYGGDNTPDRRTTFRPTISLDSTLDSEEHTDSSLDTEDDQVMMEFCLDLRKEVDDDDEGTIKDEDEETQNIFSDEEEGPEDVLTPTNEGEGQLLKDFGQTAGPAVSDIIRNLEESGFLLRIDEQDEVDAALDEFDDITESTSSEASTPTHLSGGSVKSTKSLRSFLPKKNKAVRHTQSFTAGGKINKPAWGEFNSILCTFVSPPCISRPQRGTWWIIT